MTTETDKTTTATDQYDEWDRWMRSAWFYNLRAGLLWIVLAFIPFFAVYVLLKYWTDGEVNVAAGAVLFGTLGLVAGSSYLQLWLQRRRYGLPEGVRGPLPPGLRPRQPATG